RVLFRSGLVTSFLEQLGGFGGTILAPDGTVAVDSPAAIAALELMLDGLARGVVPRAVLSYHEEEARLAFQNGRAVFMRNWPYAYAILDDPAQSKVAGKVAVAPMPAEPGGQPTAALGGAQRAINANARHPDVAYQLIAYLTAPAQQRERAEVVGQYPTRPALYDDPALSSYLRVPAAEVRRIIEAAEPRPPIPVYTELSELLQVELHRALTGQKPAAEALHHAAAGIREVLDEARLDLATGSPAPAPGPSRTPLVILGALAILGLALLARRIARVRRTGVASGAEASEARLAWAFASPALACIALIAVFPLAWTIWESFHH